MISARVVFLALVAQATPSSLLAQVPSSVLGLPREDRPMVVRAAFHLQDLDNIHDEEETSSSPASSR